MSSILEALKKLEAEKNAQHIAIQVPESAYTSDQMAQSLLGNYADSAPEGRRQSPLLLVLGGSLFTVLLIGVTVSLAVIFLGRLQGTPEPTAPPEAAQSEAVAAAVIPTVAKEAPAPTPATAPVRAPKVVVAAVETPKAPPKPQSETEPEIEAPMVVTPIPVVTEARYEPYVPQPEAREEPASAPVPEDIRTLPMLSRSERSQYRLEALTINMLNEASPTRPLGNALINLEKIFIGETLPGSNATLIDVKSHGIAIEIMSTRQRYYLPR